MRIETDSDYYYDVLSIYERLRDELKRKYGSVYKAAKFLGRSGAYLSEPNQIGSIDKLNTLCEKLDLDLEYILTGGNNNGFYKTITINLKKLLLIYQKDKKIISGNRSMRVILSAIKKGKNNIRLATLLYFADLYRTSPYRLIS